VFVRAASIEDAAQKAASKSRADKWEILKTDAAGEVNFEDCGTPEQLWLFQNAQTLGLSIIKGFQTVDTREN